MKKYLFTILAMATVLVACETEINGPIDPVETPEVAVSLSGSVPGLTRVSSDNAGIYKFQENDEITVITDNNTMRNFTAAQGAGETASFEGTIPQGESIVAAFYPASEYESYAVNKFYVPTNIVWKQDASNMPMYATVVTTQEEGKYSAEFKAVGGVLKLVCFNVPENATKMVFTAATQKIAGEFTITKDNNDNDQIVGSTSEVDNSITFDFSGNRSNNMVFYVPLPVVTLTDGFIIAFQNANGEELFSKASPKAAVITRNKLLIAPALNCATTPGPTDAMLANSDFSSVSGSYAIGSITNTFGTWNYNACTQTSANIKYLQLRNNSTVSYLQFPEFSGYIESIVLEDVHNGQGNAYSGTLYLRSTASNTASPIASVDVNLSSGDDYTFVIPNNVNVSTGYFMTSAGLRFKSLTVKFRGGYAAPAITTDVDELTFEANETSKNVTIGLVNEIDDLGIGALITGDNADNFTATIEDNTLTVTADLNLTEGDYTACVTLRASGATAKTINITQKSSLIPVDNPTDMVAVAGDASANVTWTASEHATSYVAYLHTSETGTPDTDGTDVSASINNCSLALSELTNGQIYYLYLKVEGVETGYTAPKNYVMVSFTPAEAKVLESISVTTLPTKTIYNVGETFSFAGAVVAGHYSDNTDAIITNCTTNYDGVTFASSDIGQKTVTVTYTPDPTKTTTFNITVAIFDVEAKCLAETLSFQRNQS